MFRRFTVADDISTQTALKSSVQRGIKKTITEQYPSIADFIDEIIPKKGEVLEAKGKDRLLFVVADGEPLFFRVRDGPFFPTLRVLHKCRCCLLPGWLCAETRTLCPLAPLQTPS